jgi:hypothetical protein
MIKKYIGMNGYSNGKKRCWCHWFLFDNEIELRKWHNKKGKRLDKDYNPF